MKRIFTAVLSIWMILAVTAALIPSVCLSALAGWGGGTAEPQRNGEGYYLIDNGEHLAWFSNRVNSGYKTIKAKQTASIDMSARPFTPIGTAANPFLGRYDGGGYTISNLKVSVTMDNAGLFGYIGASETTTTLYDVNGDPYTETITVPSEINNVVLEDAEISGAKNVGGIVGYSVGGAVFGCSIAGTVTGSGSNVGGIVGYNFKGGSVVNSLNTATVTGALRVGGIAGFSQADASIDGCCNTGTISAGSYVGGIVGTQSGSDCAHSYNKGAVSATENSCGGLVGYAAYGSVYCLYTIGTVSCPGEYTGIAIGNMFYGTALERVYYDRDITTMTDNFATPAEHALMLDSSFLVTLNYGRDIFVDDYFHTNNNYPLLRWQLIGWDGSMGEPSTDAYGTYQITSGSELAWFAALVNGTLSGVAQNTSAKAKVMRDILLNPPIFDETSNVWTPIGTASSPFTGTFDGGDYRISGLYINDDTLVNQGLFGRIGSGGIVKNIFLASSRIIASEGVGAIAGSNYGTIQNCFNYSYIRSIYYTGGISGSNNGTIQNCGNSGEVYGTEDVGGITGENTGGTVTSCFNMEHVYALQHAGGIIGTNYGSIHYCYNNGKVEGAVSVGGLVGYQSSNTADSFTSCYNIGSVSGAQNVGAVVGYKIPGSVTKYCYYDTERSGVSDSIATPKTTDEMAGSTLSSFPGFTSTYWVIRTPDTYFNYCPELRVFYNSSNTLLKTTSKSSAAVLKPQYTIMAEVDGEMPTYYTTLSTGSAHIGTGTGTLILVRDAVVSQTTEIIGHVTITDNEHVRTLTRSPGFSGAFLLVSNTLTLCGTGNNCLVLNGGADSDMVGESLLNVGSSGTLHIEDGTLLTKNNNEDANGGAIYNCGNLVLSGGTISANSAKFGGAVYNYGGVITGDGGTLSGNTATNGGAIFFDARSTESTLNDVAITGNNATYGGAIYNRNSTVVITGGSITGNTGLNSGGAIYNTGTVAFLGGSVTGNSAQTAAGCYQNGTLALSGTVYFGASDNIYLPSGKTVSNPERITRSGIIAYLTAADYTEGVRVLDGDACAANYAKYVMNVPSGHQELNINSSGYLIAKAVSNVAMVSKFGLYDVYYTSLKEAVNAIGADETGLVTMISDDEIEETIEVRGDVTITILGDESSNRTLIRYHTCTGPMFSIAENGTLEFGAPGSENDAALIVDGGSERYGTYGDSIIVNNGTLRIRDGATLCNASKNGNGAAVMNSGEIEMSGGSIANCSATDGGAIYNSGTLHLTGGSIQDCSGTNGGAIRSTGNLSMQGGTITGNHATNGGAVYCAGTTAIEGGTIRGNSAANGGGICIAGGTWDLREGKLTVVSTDGSGESAFVETDVTPAIAENTATVGGGGLAVLGGTGTFSAGTIQQNTAKSGGGIYLADGSACVMTTGAVLKNNTASSRGSGIYDDGALTLQNAAIDASNDIYIASGKTVVPSGTAVSAVLTPSTYTIGTCLLSGSSVAALYSGFTLSNDRFFLASDGTLNTRALSVRESSSLFVDYEKGLVLGIDPAQNTANDMIAAFDNAAAALTIRSASGTILSGSAIVTTGCVIQLRDGNTVLDSKTFVLVGDVDADGDCDAEDAVLVYARAAGKLTDAQLGVAAARAADANNDGVVNNADGDVLRACGMYTMTAADLQPTA